MGPHSSTFRVRFDECAADGAVRAPVFYGVEVTVTTEVVGFRRIWARRRNIMRAGSGDPVGEITMDWIFTDRDGQPARIVPEMERAFPGSTAGYLDLFEDALHGARVDTQGRPAVYEIEFLQQSLPGDVLHRRLWSSAGAWMMSVSTPEGIEVSRALRKST